MTSIFIKTQTRLNFYKYLNREIRSPYSHVEIDGSIRVKSCFKNTYSYLIIKSKFYENWTNFFILITFHLFSEPFKKTLFYVIWFSFNHFKVINRNTARIQFQNFLILSLYQEFRCFEQILRRFLRKVERITHFFWKIIPYVFIFYIFFRNPFF